jgi:hypothetical protein
MHDISAEAGISVGLIIAISKPRGVISAMADRSQKRLAKC